MYHYGWVRSEAEMNLKTNAVTRFWSEGPAPTVDYRQVDAVALRRFTGTHPQVVQAWLPKAEGLFQPDPNHPLTAREKKHRIMLKLEQWFGFRFNKKHYRPVR